jgi:hypothetical protein
MQWQQYLLFPDDVYLSREAEDFIRPFVPPINLVRSYH